ncbi:MAG: hypothetical protein DRQ55_13935 [Planctomycetota bacterium]|nr:MAG: hypothetical protein DRQ55_13935 [Planctomycetota bacterium]
MDAFLAQATPAALLGTKEIVFLVLFGVVGPAYYGTYRRSENLPASLLKVAGLLGFVYAVITGFDWLAAEVPADQAMVLFSDAPTAPGPRMPEFASSFTWFVWALLALVIWYARGKFTTVGQLILSAWDRGHWYLMPVIFVLMTVGLLLVAAAASPVLSPFIYTLF